MERGDGVISHALGLKIQPAIRLLGLEVGMDL